MFARNKKSELASVTGLLSLVLRQGKIADVHSWFDEQLEEVVLLNGPDQKLLKLEAMREVIESAIGIKQVAIECESRSLKNSAKEIHEQGGREFITALAMQKAAVSEMEHTVMKAIAGSQRSEDFFNKFPNIAILFTKAAANNEGNPAMGTVVLSRIFPGKTPGL